MLWSSAARSTHNAGVGSSSTRTRRRYSRRARSGGLVDGAVLHRPTGQLDRAQLAATPPAVVAVVHVQRVLGPHAAAGPPDLARVGGDDAPGPHADAQQPDR